LFQFGVCAETEGALALAASAFVRIRQVRLVSIGVGSSWSTAYPAILGRYHHARVLERQGKPAEAKAEYEDFLAHWGRADRALAEVDDARAALARLQR